MCLTLCGRFTFIDLDAFSNQASSRGSLDVEYIKPLHIEHTSQHSMFVITEVPPEGTNKHGLLEGVVF